MKRKNLRKIAVLAVSLILLLSTVLSITSCTMANAANAVGDGTMEGVFRDITDKIFIDKSQYYDGTAIQKLPSGIKDNDEISVIVNLDRITLLEAYNKTSRDITFAEYILTDEAAEIEAGILAEKQKIMTKLDKLRIDYQTGVDYSVLLAGFELVIKAGDFESTCTSFENVGTAIVSEVYNVAETKLVENTVNVYETGIFNSSGYKYDGTGMVVAVLDTGLDYTHTAFSPSNFTADRSKLGLTRDMVASCLAMTKASTMINGLTVNDVYLNDKVPFSFDYADKDADVYSLHNNHGTHVSGVIVGKDDTITGVAPNAQLVSMKIFSDIQDSAKASWILDALEDCVVLNVDVINMSLGTACGFSRESDREAMSGVYDKIREQGISMVVAASNSFSSAYGSEKNGNLGLTSNPDTATVGSPSTYEGAMSVASINGVKTPYMLHNGKIIYFVESNNSGAEERDFVEDLLPDGVDEKEYEYILIRGAGRDADYTGIDVTGKIVLVERGSNTFEEKAKVAEKKGAAGIIIYNNVSGDIKMNVGLATIAVCSISQNDGKELAEAGSGTIKISRSQKSGPFMSDFSSWGPSPSLGIKPEITAHGGNILSAITGGGYDRLSGTSMACPNLAGFTILLRQYVEENYDRIIGDNETNEYKPSVSINAMVNRLMMSTADIVLGKNGLPYAVRKQGAGLANLMAATETEAYIRTYNKDGSIMDKTKLELGDDPQKTGVYTLSFDVVNFGNTELSYNLSAVVMTEGVSDVLTHQGETTVTEEGYLLEGASVDFVVTGGGSKSGDALVVGAGKTASVTVTIKLTDENKAYLDKSFENGMYIEGFVELTAKSGTRVDLNVPYLAFYGNWAQAPIFDMDYFETNRDELDDTIPTLDKTLPDAYASRPIGGIEEDYVSYLGSYYFLQNPSDRIISADREYIAISNMDGTIHSIRFIWMGMLRNAIEIKVTITDSTTGEVIYETVEENVRKSYGDGGSYLYPANVDVEFDAYEHNLKNNTEYYVKVQGFLDYENDGSEDNLNNTFEFPFVTDFEAPTLTDCEFYTEYDRELEKDRLFVRLAIYDNHYSMATQLGYVDKSSYEFMAFSQYMTPIYSVKNGVSYVEYELTDHIYDIKNGAVNPNSIVVATYDYALNDATYEIDLPDEYVDFYFEETQITLSPNELYNITPLIRPDTEWGELLTYYSTNKNVARVVNNKIVAVAKGKALIWAQDPVSGKQTSFSVTVLGEEDEGYVYYDKPVADEFKLTGYETIRAYYMVDSSERDIGADGERRVFTNGNYFLSMYPSESVQLQYKLDAYFPNTTVEFETSDDSIVTIDQNGIIVAEAEGYSSVTVRVLLDGESTYYSQTVSIEVKDPFVTTSPTLTHYYGKGGVVEIPEELLLVEIGQFAFSNSDYIPKEPWELDPDDPSTSKLWYIGDNTITKVIIPEGVEKINAYAFANLTALETVVLPSTIEAIEYGAFYGCSKLSKVEGLEYVQLINKEAFNGCNLKGTISLDNACAIGDYAFGYNGQWVDTNGDQMVDTLKCSLKEVILPEKLQSIGAYAFAGNTALEKVTVKAEKVKYGPYVFANCRALTAISVNADVIPEGAFYGCSNLSDVTIGKDVNTIGAIAFGRTAIESFKLDSQNKSYKLSEKGDYILSADGTTLVMVAPSVSGTFTLEDSNVTKIGKGAFAYNTSIEKVVMPYVTVIEDNAFENCTSLDEYELGALEKIGDYAFFKTSIEALPSLNNIEEIGAYAFAYTDLVSVKIPANMKVGEGAFCECDYLVEVEIGENVTLGMGAFMLSRDENNQIVRDESVTDKKIYMYKYLSKLTSLTIGNGVTIGDSAFMGAASLEEVTMGDNVVIGDKAFYSACSLKTIDLSGVISIGESAFDGDILYAFTDANAQNVAIENGYYVYRYYMPKLEEINLSSLTYLGKQAFMNNSELTKVTLGAGLEDIPVSAFEGCEKLTFINLDNVKFIDTQAFAESGLLMVDLSNAIYVGDYAFVNCENLLSVNLSEAGTEIGEGAFAYTSLVNVGNLDKVEIIDAYAFAYSNLTKLNLSSSVEIGDFAFMKDALTEVELTLGDKIAVLGDNPFAMCKVARFEKEIIEEFNGQEYIETIYTFDISDTVKIIDGSIYCVVPSGLELITFCGSADKMVEVAEGTVRITGMAFAGSDVVRVTLPHSLDAIGHKAFYDCDKLVTVVFKSYEAPILEEEFDQSYYDSFENLPSTGKYEFTDYEGNIITHTGLGIVPYYMWNVSDGKYSNVYYGANFVNQIGHGNPELIMVRPSNGQYYETFIYSQYFTMVIDGAVAMDDVTLEAIEAINNIPEKVQLSHEALVILARELYNKIATKEQQALVENYSQLVSAENRILALKSQNMTPDTPDTDLTPDDNTQDTEKKNNTGFIVAIVILSLTTVVNLLIAVGAGTVAVLFATGVIKLGAKNQASAKVELPKAEEPKPEEKVEEKAEENQIDKEEK